MNATCFEVKASVVDLLGYRRQTGFTASGAGSGVARVASATPVSNIVWRSNLFPTPVKNSLLFKYVKPLITHHSKSVGKGQVS